MGWPVFYIEHAMFYFLKLSIFMTFYFAVILNLQKGCSNTKKLPCTLHPDSPNVNMLPHLLYHSLFACVFIYIFTYINSFCSEPLKSKVEE